MLSKIWEASKFQSKPYWILFHPSAHINHPVPSLFHLRCGIKSSWSITWLLLQAMLPASWPMSLAWQMPWIPGSRRPSGGKVGIVGILRPSKSSWKCMVGIFLPFLLGFGNFSGAMSVSFRGCSQTSRSLRPENHPWSLLPNQTVKQPKF